MSTHKTLRYWIPIVLPATLLATGSCCPIGDGIWYYVVQGRAVDRATLESLSGATFSFSRRSDRNHRVLAIVAEDGSFVVRDGMMHQLSACPWSPPLEAAPPTLDAVYLSVELDGRAATLDVVLTPDQQSETSPARRVIDLGTLEFDLTATE